MKKLLVATTIAAITLTTPTTVFAKPNNVRYSTGIVTGAKSITTTDGNIYGKRDLPTDDRRQTHKTVLLNAL